MGKGAQLYQVEHIVDASAEVTSDVSLSHSQRELKVSANGHVRKKGVSLEDHPDVASVRSQARNVFISDCDRSGRRRLETRDHRKKRRLARSRWADDRDEFPRRDV